MSTSESDFQLSVDENPRASSRSRQSRTPKSPRKRRRSRSESPNQQRNSKRHHDGQYNDAYRSLFNENITAAANRFDLTDPFFHDSSHPINGQFGASIWSSKEKSMFYAALERLGKDDVPGIAEAIGSKSIPETRELLLVLRDASIKHGEMRLTLRDIPAAAEVSAQCNERLELAGDALAWYQERFEAKQEQERFGDHWLITPEIAEKVEDAVKPSRQSSVVSESTPAVEGELVKEGLVLNAQILQDIPEGNLFKVSTLLTLSSSLFMNACPDLTSPSQHWMELTSPLADKPSIYRTALLDFQTLVQSLTRRLTQACIMQATSRIRTQGWRSKKGVNSLVKRRDVNAAIDMLGLKRDGQERWRGVARRSRFRVFDGVGKSRRQLSWNAVEEALAVSDRFSDTGLTDGETSGAESGTEEEFKAKAVRSGTPLPTGSLKDYDYGSENDSGEEYEEEEEEENIDDSFAPASPASIKTSRNSPKFELNTLEDFDHEASRNEEARLWDIIGAPPPGERGSPKREDEVEELELKETNKLRSNNDDWRNWTEYRGAWEDLQTVAPATKFRANQKPITSCYPLSTGRSDLDYDTHASQSSSAEQRSGSRKKRVKTSKHEIPIRGARAYAALQEDRIAISEDRDVDTGESGEEAEPPIPSVEEDAGP
jgi:RNA polymerase I-specific transcription initiation factor RRN5